MAYPSILLPPVFFSSSSNSWLFLPLSLRRASRIFFLRSSEQPANKSDTRTNRVSQTNRNGIVVPRIHLCDTASPLYRYYLVLLLLALSIKAIAKQKQSSTRDQRNSVMLESTSTWPEQSFCPSHPWSCTLHFALASQAEALTKARRQRGGFLRPLIG